MKKWKIYFVPHTHWDKEWYFTKESSTVFLVDNIHKLHEIITAQKEQYFGIVYDGQFSIVDDYLAVYPEDYNFIKQMIQERKLIVGPWYTQTDTFNTTGESIIRNLMTGHLGAERFGHSQKVGYLPDSFGFNTNMPQILAEAECPMIFQWRGICQDTIKDGLYNLWQGVDGTKLPLYNFYKPGYGMTIWAFADSYKAWEHEDLTASAQKYLAKFKGDFKDIDDWKRLNPHTQFQICLPFGSDQFPVISQLEAFIRELNVQDSENEWILATYDQFAEQLQKTVPQDTLPLITGELKYGQYSRTHRTIASSRVDIKQHSKKLEYQLYRAAEPLAVLYSHFGGEYPERIFETVLKKMLECHAHDSLGGSCTDRTNEQVLNRLIAAQTMLESQMILMQRRMAEAVGVEKNDVQIFNTLAYSRDVEFTCTIYSRTPAFRLVATNGETINFAVLDQEFRDYRRFTIADTLLNKHIDNSDRKGHFKTQVRFTIPQMPGLSYQVLHMEEIEANSNVNISLANFIENQEFKIELNKNGTLTIIDKQHKIQFAQAVRLECMTNAGDTYDYSPDPEHPKMNNELLNQSFYSIETNGVHKFFITQEYRITSGFETRKTIEQQVLCCVVLNHRAIDFEIKMHNNASDVRWRLLFDTHQSHKYSYADQSCAIMQRAVHDKHMSTWEQDCWKDMPIEIETMESMVYLKVKDGYTSAFVTQGENEYQVIGEQDNILALTLFCGASFIGRRGLMYRPGRASGIDAYPYATPESNLQKDLNFKVRMLLGEDALNLPRMASEWVTPSVYFQNQKLDDYAYAGQSFWMAKRYLQAMPKAFSLYSDINLTKHKTLIQTALKQAVDGKSWILRCYNAGLVISNYDDSKPRVNILEHVQHYEKAIRPNQIVTWKVAKL